MNIKEQIEKRQEFNIEILNYIKEEITLHPELRFIQLLMNMGIISREDRFYEESFTTRNKLKDNYDKKR